MRQTGTVKLFKEDKGFGFITPDGGGADCFVHIKGVIGRQALVSGERVEFELEPGMKGPQAVRVAMLDCGALVGNEAQGGAPASSPAWGEFWQPSPAAPPAREHRRRDRDVKRYRDRPRRHWADD